MLKAKKDKQPVKSPYKGQAKQAHKAKAGTANLQKGKYVG